MWFGDLVTMRWWDDLWLKESFADYMGAAASAEATRWRDAWVAFANRRKARAYLQDQLPTTHPIVADIADLEAAKLNFDGITYAKGASVLKQLVAYVGRDAFFAGVRRYFREHAYGNTTLADLLTALSGASDRDLGEWARAWLQTSGVSTLWLDDGAVCQTDPRSHRLALGRCDFDDSSALVAVDRLELDLVGERTPVQVPDAPLGLLNDGAVVDGAVGGGARVGGGPGRGVDRGRDGVGSHGVAACDGGAAACRREGGGVVVGGRGRVADQRPPRRHHRRLPRRRAA